MIRKLLATTALATLIAGAAYAQDTTAPAPAPVSPAEQATPAAPAIDATGFLATNIIGETVYDGSGDGAENIGSVNDMVIGDNGQLQAVVVGVGGFLGIGEKNVAIDYSTLTWAEGNGDRWLVADTSKEALEALPEFNRGAYDMAPVTTTDAAPGTMAPADTTAQAPVDPAGSADTTAQAPADAAAPADTMAQGETAPTVPDSTMTGAIDKSTLTEMPADQIRAEEMVGTTVYGADDANVGEIGDIVLSTDGKIDAFIIDVGGFLGMGEKEVAIGSDNLAFMADGSGNKYLYTKLTKEQLEAAPAYDEATYANTRDSQRLNAVQ